MDSAATDALLVTRASGASSPKRKAAAASPSRSSVPPAGPPRRSARTARPPSRSGEQRDDAGVHGGAKVGCDDARRQVEGSVHHGRVGLVGVHRPVAASQTLPTATSRPVTTGSAAATPSVVVSSSKPATQRVADAGRGRPAAGRVGSCRAAKAGGRGAPAGGCSAQTLPRARAGRARSVRRTGSWRRSSRPRAGSL